MEHLKMETPRQGDSNINDATIRKWNTGKQEHGNTGPVTLKHKHVRRQACNTKDLNTKRQQHKIPQQYKTGTLENRNSETDTVTLKHKHIRSEAYSTKGLNTESDSKTKYFNTTALNLKH